MLINLIYKIILINNILLNSIEISNFGEIFINKVMRLWRKIQYVINIRIIDLCIEECGVHSMKIERSTFLKHLRNVQ